MKLNELKKPAIYGGILAIFIIILEIIILFSCKESLGCLGLAFFIALPSVLVGISPGTYLDMWFNILFYFLLGALIGYLVQKFKK